MAKRAREEKRVNLPLSDGDLGPQFHHPARRDVEKLGGIGGVFHQEDKQVVLPQRHGGALIRYDGAADGLRGLPQGPPA